ncbi:hypothetical protein GGX14DRAFT_401813 [Mycena pura]|uniref:C2H2-type domain-containing protein n=1 Tax=Mycena pura TaxID=153505 RepID=A0AAD6V099_9AGAR|nr:hypothetical protein GGX14DRAFT_401813 [Mycena pura]
MRFCQAALSMSAGRDEAAPRVVTGPMLVKLEKIPAVAAAAEALELAIEEADREPLDEPQDPLLVVKLQELQREYNSVRKTELYWLLKDERGYFFDDKARRQAVGESLSDLHFADPEWFSNRREAPIDMALMAEAGEALDTTQLLAPNPPTIKDLYLQAVAAAEPYIGLSPLRLPVVDSSSAFLECIFSDLGSDMHEQRLRACELFAALPDQPTRQFYPNEGAGADGNCIVCHKPFPTAEVGSPVVHAHSCARQAQQTAANEALDVFYSQRACLWKGCGHTFSSAFELVAHVGRLHSGRCQWRLGDGTTCGKIYSGTESHRYTHGLCPSKGALVTYCYHCHQWIWSLGVDGAESDFVEHHYERHFQELLGDYSVRGLEETELPLVGVEVTTEHVIAPNNLRFDDRPNYQRPGCGARRFTKDTLVLHLVTRHCVPLFGTIPAPPHVARLLLQPAKKKRAAVSRAVPKKKRMAPTSENDGDTLFKKPRLQEDANTSVCSNSNGKKRVMEVGTALVSGRRKHPRSVLASQQADNLALFEAEADTRIAHLFSFSSAKSAAPQSSSLLPLVAASAHPALFISDLPAPLSSDAVALPSSTPVLPSVSLPPLDPYPSPAPTPVLPSMSLPPVEDPLPPPTPTPTILPAPPVAPLPSLEEFCRGRGIDERTQNRLTKLEYEPGQPLEDLHALPEEDWKEFTLPLLRALDFVRGNENCDEKEKNAGAHYNTLVGTLGVLVWDDLATSRPPVSLLFRYPLATAQLSSSCVRGGAAEAGRVGWRARGRAVSRGGRALGDGSGADVERFPMASLTMHRYMI